MGRSGSQARHAPEQNGIDHIAEAQWADALVVAPATANILAKFAHGIADDFLSTLYLATTAPVLVAPAMNVNMWNHPATQANLEILRQRGVAIVEPGTGELACGMVGAGRMAEPEAIAAAVLSALGRRHDLAGEVVLVTAGGTREALDPVRFIGNRSSGKMGYALAEAARSRGAKVILISGPSACMLRAHCELVKVTTADEMRNAVLARMNEATLVIKAAAVADYRPVAVSEQKLKRTGPLTLELAPTEDILAEVVRRRRPGQLIVGFAAETENRMENGRAKLLAKGADAIVVNDVAGEGVGIDADTNAATFLTRATSVELPQMPKRQLADRILDEILTLRRPRHMVLEFDEKEDAGVERKAGGPRSRAERERTRRRRAPPAHCGVTGLPRALDSATRDALAERLRFYRDLGLTEFYRRPMWSRSPQSTIPSLGRSVAEELADREGLCRLRLQLRRNLRRVPAHQPNSFGEEPTIKTRKVFPRHRRSPAQFPWRSARRRCRPFAKTSATARAARCTRAATRSSLPTASPTARLMFVGEGPGADEDAQGAALCGPRRATAQQHDRGDGPEARRVLHRQRGQVPAAGQPHAGAGRGQYLLAVSFSPDRCGAAAGSGGAGRDGGDLSAGRAAAAGRAARARARISRNELDRHLSSGVSAARSAAEEGSLGRSADCDEGTGTEGAGKSLSDTPAPRPLPLRSPRL